MGLLCLSCVCVPFGAGGGVGLELSLDKIMHFNLDSRN